ncbi:MAG: hypothetical protein VB081_08565 [Christensenella sp.]|uniref:anti-sigma-I factor RsgI family protein n=1 Tax=Christensenella sp. TaxID=1935934 RepID=UPI002B1FB0DE|nr:hypothetical protein [Christensenella sp.]MEA5003537.1 hypothetical protein [Christensenella sp.]
MNRIKDAFSEIKAEDELVQKTIEAVTRKTTQRKPRSFGRALGIVAGVACAFVLMVVGGVLYTSQTAYISIDVNPSIELSVNRFDRVVDAVAKNEDGEAVLSGIKIQNLKYTDALNLIIGSEQKLGYLQDGSDIVFAVQSNDGIQQKTLLQQSESYAENAVGLQNTACYAVNGDEWNEAHQHGISPGKYKAIQELQEYDSTVTVEEYAHHSTREIRQEIRHHQDGNANQDLDNAQGQGNGDGQGQGSGGGQGNGNGNDGNHGNGNYNGNGHGSGGNGAKHE